MKKNRKNLKKPRAIAYQSQKGRCFYCNRKMWLNHPDELKPHYSLSGKQSKQLQCTGEHLVPFKDGGSCSGSNIVAACLFCNRKRHARKKELTLERFKSLVERRISKGGWFPWPLINSMS